MKYERLTERAGSGKAFTIGCATCPDICFDCEYAKSAIDRLCELEDKIEQGTLKEEKTCENVSEMHPVDGFTCSECGITIIDFREERVDEEDCTASWYEYEFKYCPNCGEKVVKNG